MTDFDKIICSTGRAFSFVMPNDDRDAELMSIGYIGLMAKMGCSSEDILKIASTIKHNYKELSSLVNELA